MFPDFEVLDGRSALYPQGTVIKVRCSLGKTGTRNSNNPRGDWGLGFRALDHESQPWAAYWAAGVAQDFQLFRDVDSKVCGLPTGLNRPGRFPGAGISTVRSRFPIKCKPGHT